MLHHHGRKKKRKKKKKKERRRIEKKGISRRDHHDYAPDEEDRPSRGTQAPDRKIEVERRVIHS